MGPVLEPSRSSGGCWEAAGSAYIGSQRAAGVVWNMAGVVSKRFREGLGGHGDPLRAILELFQTLPGAPGGHWEMLGGAGSTKIVVSRLLGAVGSTKIVFWRLPGAVGSTIIVVVFSGASRRHGPLQRCQQRLSGTPPNHAFLHDSHSEHQNDRELRIEN